ncbi:hypothetical protein LTR62_004088 [Meristemomyces frigidus]|uniref:Non-structural maintenance of chromosomes element 1 homolog n=1 Tax=Meristemomyces frigidus TaxID=1508187 RepID=A0AAN7YU29_9PEZI|nr:hypothetical protein LTR62_004088 [Meristemomyces frigidus]
MAQGDGGSYNNTHRAFLQALLSTQTITYPTAKPLLAAIQTAQTPERPTLPEDISQDEFETYIDTLNTHISPFDFEVKNTLNQSTKERVYALVNTTSDALTQMSTTHSPDELSFMKRVLDAMFETYNTRSAEIMAIKPMQAMKLARPLSEGRGRESQAAQTQQAKDAGLTQAQAEKVLEILSEEGWFELSAKGFYSLSPRALMELRGWLVEMYNDQDAEDEDEDEDERVKIKFCAACKEIVTVGQRCSDINCQARVHDHCVGNLFRAQQGREACPSCKKGWKNALPVGEKAAGGQRQSINGGSRQSDGARGNEREEEDSDEVESGAEQEG